jgi:hypothetical protein
MIVIKRQTMNRETISGYELLSLECFIVPPIEKCHSSFDINDE